jgi:serine/threonine protein kinase
VERQSRQIADWLRTAVTSASGKQLGAGYQASLRLFESPYGRLVVKSAHAHGLRGSVAKASIRREQRAYERLGGIPGIAKSYGLLDEESLVLEHIEGPSLREYETELQDRERFFADLLEIIDAMHAAGVAHGDLKRKDNTLVGPDRRPYVVDFGIACIRRNQDGIVNRWCFEWMRQMDYNAWIKLKYGRKPTGLSPEDAARYRPLWLERVARWIRIPWQKLTMRRLRQRWRGRKIASSDNGPSS